MSNGLKSFNVLKKKCPFCLSSRTRKYGKFRNRQRYKCNDCQKTFGSVKKPQRLNLKLFNEYALGKQTLAQLSNELHLNPKTVQNHLDQVVLAKFKVTPRPIILVLDATYLGEKKAKDGVLVGKDWLTKEIVYYKFIQSETKQVYQECKDSLINQGFEILAVIVDGRPGIRNVFRDIPIQMCQFHQIQIVNRYLTKNPKLLPSKQLKTIIEDLVKSNQTGFVRRLKYWFEVNEEFINEKTINLETGRSIYKHKKLRSAVNSIRNNLPYLFTYKNKEQSNIPNTTNSLVGWFAHLKKLLNCHNGLRKDRRKKVIEYILATRNYH